MEKIKIDNNVFIPMPMSILGVRLNNKENYMAVGWICRVNEDPPLIAMGIGNNHLTLKGINDNKEFSINFPSENLIIETDFVGMYSGDTYDKSNIFKSNYGELKNAPLIDECPLNLSCKLVDIIKLPTNSIVIGEIVEAICDKNFYVGKNINFNEMKTFFLTMPYNKYWSFGNEIGKAWSDGRKFLN